MTSIQSNQILSLRYKSVTKEIIIQVNNYFISFIKVMCLIKHKFKDL